MSTITPKVFWERLKSLDISEDTHCLLALSGGADSVTLFHLLVGARVPFSAAHVNYGLRGSDSQADEQFCADLCAQKQVPFYLYDAKSEMENRTVSLQEEARNIRYRFFDKLVREHDFKYILTAHHANDSFETFFVNLLRGTGINGLKGIPEKNGNRRRPLLPLTQSDISALLRENGWEHRHDKSNEKDDYLRNRIRHHVLPAIEKSDGNAVARLGETMVKLSAEADLLDFFMKSHFTENEDYMSKHSLLFFPEAIRPTVVFRLYRNVGINYSQAMEIARALTAIPGKVFSTDTHRILVDRDFVFIQPVNETFEDALSITEQGTIPGYKMAYLSKDKVEFSGNPDVAYLDADTLRFPLTWRLVRLGDFMIPMGMKGKKKISDILVDTKKTRFEKERIHVLCNGNEIIWLEGFRVSDSSKITAHTSRVLRIMPEKL